VLDGGGAACDCGGETVPAAIPAVLNGKFRLEKVAGRGGMGVVYAARDLSLGRAVALKTLPRLSADLSLRLRQEARAMASLMHPHLALIFGAETWRGVPVLVLEYLAGGTLADRMSGRLAAAEAVAVARDVALALQALHREGLVHRDVKPSNVGFTERGVVKLLDFGLAQLLEPGGGTALGGPVVRPGARAELTPHDRVVGTPLYLSPEALAGRPPSPAQDAWALGLVLHEAIAGRHPCHDGGGDVRWSDLGRTPPDVREWAPDCPPGVARLLGELLAADPRRRLSGMDDVVARLGAEVG
jgi:serine/threonine-protein kinase